VWRFESREVGGALVVMGTVLASGIVPELVGGGFGEEISFRGKDLGIEQFGFDGVMHTFDIGIGIGAGGRVKAVLGPEGLLDGEVRALRPVVKGNAIEFAAQVGGDDELTGIDAVALEVLEEALDAAGRIGFVDLVTVCQERRTAGEIPPKVLPRAAFEQYPGQLRRKPIANESGLRSALFQSKELAGFERDHARTLGANAAT
jgi:hypothetical protein